MTRTTRLAATLALLSLGSALHAQDRGRGRGEPAHKPAAVPAQEQQQRAAQEEQRTSAYKRTLDHQVHVVQQKTATLDRAKRPAQLRAQQAYAAELQKQRQEMPDRRDFTADPYVSAPGKYRYLVDGAVRQTNEYGAQVLRQAVDNGYQQGYLAGQADRADHWKSSYQTSPAYEDANYGFAGNYVAQADYNYYFRQGFRRGYQDGFGARLQYGANSNGTTSILSNVLTRILGLTAL